MKDKQTEETYTSEDTQNALNMNISGNLMQLKKTSTTKLDLNLIEPKVLSSPLDFVNYLEVKIPEKEAKLQNLLFPLKVYESNKESKYTISELNPDDMLYSKFDTKEFYSMMAYSDKIIYSDINGNIKFFSLKDKKIIKILNYPLKAEKKIYKVNAFDISPDEIYTFVGYDNGEIALFEKNKFRDIIIEAKSGINDIKIISQTKKIFKIIYCDKSGNVELININNKKKETTEMIYQNSKNPCYSIYIPTFKDIELNTNKSLKEFGDSFILINSENIIIYTYEDNAQEVFKFKKPHYIKDDSYPDIAMGIGKQPSSNELTDGDADLLLLLLYSWEKVIYLNVLPNMSTFEYVIPSGYYINEAPIIKIGFLNISTIYLIDKEGNFKILNSRKFNQGNIQIEEGKIIPENNKELIKNVELQMVFKMDGILSYDYSINTKNMIKIYNIINNRNTYEFYAFTNNTVYVQKLNNYQTYIDSLFKKGEWNDLLLLSMNIYKGKMSALTGIPTKIEERKKKLKDFLQNLVLKYVELSLDKDVEEKMEIIIEFCLEVGLGVFLFEKVLKKYEDKKYKELFLNKLEPFIICNKIKDYDVPHNVILDLIKIYQNGNDLEKRDKLDQLLCHFNLKTLSHSAIKQKIQELNLISPQIYISINDKNKDYFKPAILLYNQYISAQEIEPFESYEKFIKKNKKNLYEIKLTKIYFGHKLLWYLQNTLDRKKFPTFIESIDNVLYYSIITKLTYWLLSDQVFQTLINLEPGIFFNILTYIFSNEDLIESFEENDEDPEKKAEALKLLKSNPNSSYKSQNVDSSDLIKYIVDIGNEFLKNKEKSIVNLYLKIFIIAVGHKIKLDVQTKKEAIIFVIEKYNNKNMKLSSQEITKKILSILEGKDFQVNDFDKILDVMTKGSFDDVRFFIYKKQMKYIKCLNLLLEKDVEIKKLEDILFTFINMTLTRLQIKKKLEEYKEFKTEVRNNLIKIIKLSEKSIEKVSTIIDFWYKKDKKLCLNALREDQQIQLKYIEYKINRIIEAKEKNEDDINESEDFMKYLLERHVQLLCNLNKKNEIYSWLKKLDEYPIKECIELCKKYQVYDSLIFLYKKEGNTSEALNICYRLIKKCYDEIKSNYKSDKFNTDLFNSQKEQFNSLLNGAIDVLEFEENLSYNESSSHSNNNEDHKLWGVLLKDLYVIQSDFEKEVPEKNRIDIYKNISDLILTQIQNLIVGMSPYVGVNHVFDYVFKINKSAKVIEFKPFFAEILKNYGVEINILKFYLDSLTEFSLDEEKLMEEENTKGENFELNKDNCEVCNNNLENFNMNAKVTIFKCHHKEHSNCSSKNKVCIKCLKKNYLKWIPRKENKDSKNPDEKDFSEFLKIYKVIKEEMNKKEKEEKEKEQAEDEEGKREKKEKKKGLGFTKKFGKLSTIDNYNRKNKKILNYEGFKFYNDNKIQKIS